MRVYIKECKDITNYFEAKKAGIGYSISLMPNNLISLEWYEIIELGGLNFRFVYCKTSVKNLELKTKRFIFKYINGKVIFTNNKTTKFTMSFGDTLRKLGCIKIRIPNLEEYISKSFFPPFISLGEKSCINKEGNPYVNFYELNEFIKNRIKPNKIRALLKLFNITLTKDTTHLEFSEIINNILEIYIKSYYDDIRIPLDKLEIIKYEGWELMGLDQIDEMVEMYHLTEFGGNQIFFKKGNESCAVLNKTKLPIVITRAGNINTDSDSIFDLLFKIGSDIKYTLI